MGLCKHFSKETMQMASKHVKTIQLHESFDKVNQNQKIKGFFRKLLEETAFAACAV